MSYTAAQTAGDTNIVAIGWNDTAATISSVKDSAGNSYQVAVPMGQTTGLRQAIYYARNIATSSGNTLTVTFSQPAQAVDIRSAEYRNLDQTNPFDAGSTASGTAATATSRSATTTSSGELLVGAGMTVGLFSGAGSGYTTRLLTTPDGDIMEDRIVTAIGSYTATAPVSGRWLMQLATFRVATP